MQDFREDLFEHTTQVLALLGDALDVDMRLDQEGSCFFEHDNGWRMGVMLAGEDQLVAAVSVLPNVTPPSDARLASILTEFNWLGGRTNGAALSWNPAGNSFVVWRSRDAETATPVDINADLLRLVETAEDLRPALFAELEENAPARDDQAPQTAQRV